jgi:hypothetical protein
MGLYRCTAALDTGGASAKETNIQSATISAVFTGREFLWRCEGRSVAKVPQYSPLVPLVPAARSSAWTGVRSGEPTAGSRGFCGRARNSGGAWLRPDLLPCPSGGSGRYSINLSASASHLGGMSMLSAFAVARLNTSSYFVGSSTGKSPGFSPLRMRPT